MQHGLTRKQQECFDYIRDHIKATGMAPSVREIMAGLNLRGTQGVHRVLTALEERGWITRQKYRARSIALVSNNSISEEKLRALIEPLRANGNPDFVHGFNCCKDTITYLLAELHDLKIGKEKDNG